MSILKLRRQEKVAVYTALLCSFIAAFIFFASEGVADSFRQRLDALVAIVAPDNPTPEISTLNLAKVLAGGTDTELLALLKKHFTTVKHAKPPASRKGSPEI